MEMQSTVSTKNANFCGTKNVDRQSIFILLAVQHFREAEFYRKLGMGLFLVENYYNRGRASGRVDGRDRAGQGGQAGKICMRAV